jgi:hypothetical protein
MRIVAEAVYLLCALTSAGCAVLLLRHYAEVRSRRRGGLLLWSSVCFAGLALANMVLFVDLVLFPEVDLSLLRAALGALSSLVLVVGLIWECE